MGEICKDPQIEVYGRTVKKTIRALVDTQGAAQIIRFLQYCFEDISNETRAANADKAAKFLQAADALDEPYNQIKNDIRL